MNQQIYIDDDDLAVAIAERSRHPGKMLQDAIGIDPAGVALQPHRLIPLGDGRYQVVTDTDYIETLERAVLKAGTYEDLHGWPVCNICDDSHAPDCIIPALLEKYADD